MSAPAPYSTDRDLWTRANLKEVLPELPSPLAMSAMETFTGPLMLASFESTGYRFPDGVVLFRAFAGRPYFNVGLLRGMVADLGLPPEVIDQAVGRGQALSRPSARWNWRQARRQVPTLLRSLYRQTRAATDTARWLGHAEVVLAEMTLVTDRASRAMPDQALFDDGDRMLAEMAHFIVHTSYLVAAANLDFYELERALVGRVPTPGAVINQAVTGEGNVSTELPLALMRVGVAAREEPHARHYFAEHRGTWQGFREALRGTRTLDLFERLLDRHGDRAIFESDEANPRYREAPGYLLGVIAQYVRSPDAPDPDAQVNRQQMAARAAHATIRQVAGWRWPELRWRLRRLRRLLALREANRFQAVRLIAQVRRRDLVLAQRMVARGWLDRADDYFWLTWPELRNILRPEAADPLWQRAYGVRPGLIPQSFGVALPQELAREAGHLRAAVAARRARYARYATITVPDEPDDPEAVERFARGRGPVPAGARRRPPPRLTGFGATAAGPPSSPPPVATAASRPIVKAASPTASDSILRGLGVSAGRAQGTARVIYHPEEFGRLHRGDILVCPATDPAWSPLFPLVAGLVVEIGGQLSHASIVAREYGIPAVVNVPNATVLIPDGASIALDAAAGTVRVMARGRGVRPRPTTDG